LHDVNLAHEGYELPPRVNQLRSPTPSSDDDVDITHIPDLSQQRSASPTRTRRTTSISDRSHGRPSRTEQMMLENTERWRAMEEDKEAAKAEEKRLHRAQEEEHNREMRRVAREQLDIARRGTRASTTTGWARGYMDYPERGQPPLTWEQALAKAERRYDRETEDMVDLLL